MKPRKLKIDEALYEIKDLFARGWDVRCVRTFVKGIHDKVNRALIWNGEHLRETLDQSAITGLTCAVVVFLVEAVEYIAKMIRTMSELSEK